ncbi:hypothetical protein [uncultured Microbulbifer sp.]|uniref:hypothetical protein n=1 Tax=uncultured Microbulbifer sp. TaxID=348147 RepID=UPI0025F10F81|nr:hypothetical protein [uncultured Microbulbifer sp.]
MHNKQRQSDSQRYAPFVLLAAAQTLTQNVLRAGCACAGRYGMRPFNLKRRSHEGIIEMLVVYG